jgi:hypothetical protein
MSGERGGTAGRALDVFALPDTGRDWGRAAFEFLGRHQDEVERHMEPEDRVHLGDPRQLDPLIHPQLDPESYAQSDLLPDLLLDPLPARQWLRYLAPQLVPRFDRFPPPHLFPHSAPLFGLSWKRSSTQEKER